MKCVGIVLAVFVLLTSCVQNDEFEVPIPANQLDSESISTLVQNSTELTITQVKSLFVNVEPAQVISSDVYVKGYVTSTDEFGNYYKEFYIQDSPENPSAGIRVAVEISSIFARYNVGREVYVNLKGLYVGEQKLGDGIITIGGAVNEEGEVEAIKKNRAVGYVTYQPNGNEEQHEGCLLRSAVTVDITPLQLSLAEVHINHMGIYVALESQFASAELGGMYVDASDPYATIRRLEDCLAYGYISPNIVVETSSYASFKQIPLPLNRGLVKGVVTNNYNGSQLILKLNESSDVFFDSERCELKEESLFTTIYAEDFNDANHNEEVDFDGWVNYALMGTRKWKEKLVQDNGFCEFSAYGSNNVENIGWLVSPPINLSGTTETVMRFQTAHKYLSSPLNTLKVFVSTDFNGGEILNSNWEQLACRVASSSDNWEVWVDSGLIDLSSYSGEVRVAFVYVGSGTDTNLDASIRLDDFEIKGINN